MAIRTSSNWKTIEIDNYGVITHMVNMCKKVWIHIPDLEWKTDDEMRVVLRAIINTYLEEKKQKEIEEAKDKVTL